MSTRLKRIETMIAHVLREAILFRVSDEALREVEITQVSITPDLRLARVSYIITGLLGARDAKREADIAERLERVRKFLRGVVTEQVNIKYSPDLRFYYDEGREKELRIEQLLHELD